MLDLAQYIHDLMLEHDCVSVPNFGGMVAQRFRAEINPGTNIMRPPSKRISYHKDLVANSHLILQKVMREKRLSETKASEQIAATVSLWKTQLQTGNSIKLDGVGRFYLDKEGAICFNQSLESNFDLDAFGLEMFRATAIKRDSDVKESVTVAIAESVKHTNQRFPFWRAAAVFVGIGALLAIGFFKSDFSVQDKLKASFNPLNYSRAIEVPVIKEVVLPVEETSPMVETPAEKTLRFEDVVPETPAVKPQIKKETPVAIQPNNTTQQPYQVIVGSFKESVNAQEMVHTLVAQGYPAQIVADNSGFAKVSIEGFSTRTEAVQAMRAYQLSVNKGAWIYSK